MDSIGAMGPAHDIKVRRAQRPAAAPRCPRAVCAWVRVARTLAALELSSAWQLLAGPRAQVTTSDLRGQVGRIQDQVKEIQEVVRMYSSTTGPRRVRRQKMESMSAEVVDTNVRRPRPRAVPASVRSRLPILPPALPP